MEKIFDNLNSKKAITLISLVVTIVILVILAAVAINMTIGNNGLFNKTKIAKQEYANSVEKEKSDIDVLTNDIDTSVGNSREQITIDKSEYNQIKNDIEYLKKQVAALQTNTVKFIDYSRELATITTQGGSYTATEDCVALAYLTVKENYEARLFVDGKTVAALFDNTATSSSYKDVRNMIYVKKGSVISTRADHGEYNVVIYGVQSVVDTSNN